MATKECEAEKVLKGLSRLGIEQPMTFRDSKAADEWEKGLEKNKDSYGQGVYRFASKWAKMMEAELSAGKKLKDIAESCSHAADTEGITGFMYGCARSMLCAWWIHGEELKKVLK